jgi:Ca2+-binding EF-hand superfamily protein
LNDDEINKILDKVNTYTYKDSKTSREIDFPEFVAFLYREMSETDPEYDYAEFFTAID